jgi:SAM-dependent methyltransferase
MPKMDYLNECPICGSKDLRLAYRWNNFQSSPGFRSTHPKEWQQSDYTLCRRCGVIFARLRQSFGDYEAYYREFETGGKKKDWFADFPPSEEYLSDQEKDADRTLQFLKDQKVLEGKKRALVLRTDSGFVVKKLRDEFGIQDVYGLDYFAANLRYAREIFGLNQLGELSSKELKVPFEGRFDLVICNHQLMHAFRPKPLLAAIRNVVTPEGHVFFYNEDDHEVIFRPGKTPYHWGVVNNFHKQLCTRDSLENALRVNGFDAVVSKRSPDTLMAVCTPAEPLPPDRLPKRNYHSIADSMARVGRRFAYLQFRSWAAGATGLKYAKSLLKSSSAGPKREKSEGSQ